MISRELQTSSKSNSIWPENWLKKTNIMGVINITPDSFSDGGKYSEPSKALQRASLHLKSGADVIDIGAQSTRPGAHEIGYKEEINRLLIPLKLIRNEFPKCIISVDTYNSKVAYKSLESGANWINDISGGRFDPDILNVVSSAKCPYVLTHSRGNSKTMDSMANYNDLINDVRSELLWSTDRAMKVGVLKKNIIWDLGLGFAKSNEHNLLILREIEKFLSDGFPILLGPSLKRFIGFVLNKKDPEQRYIGTAAVVCRCAQANISMVRVHNVEQALDSITMTNQIFM